ncbi:MAG TPA: EF-hand domain-containing protein [Rhodocyclaceae bacterium]|nr:EF-hand domain-containing protein [Rhodocyclaceae bacterium]
MTSSIGSSYGSMPMMHRPDPTQMASKLFSKLDTKNQGYIDKSDLQSAFAQISGSSGSGSSDTSVDEVFKQLDGDGDGKITKDEMTSGFKKLADELDSQFNNMRMNGHGGHGHHGGMEGMAGAGGMPPPPPQGAQGGQDSGFTKDELTSQLQEIGSSDSKRSDFLSSIVNNFDKADADGDGKVTRQEARAYRESTESASGSGSASSSTSGTASADSDERKIMHKIMQLMHAYGAGQDAGQSGVASVLSASA